ncbi:hypothetical protein BD410DRAFT_316030 [Rickenella mellea]|uniref:Uncharacterized protein n=1 Tax=Rickenella mellea TaxID=50990 RepID=A0A4Y7Q1K6_9AGAM|nr:hypothetical protein BD410DRAFT_316030 [Rickenella mellea]
MARPNPVVHIALVLAAVYICVPLYFHFFPYSSSKSNFPASGSSNASDDTQSKSNPPALYFLALLNRFILASMSYTWTFMTHLPHVPLYPLRIVLPPILTILHPAILAVKLIMDAVILTPYRIVSKVAEFFYPLYVFCGVACVFGAILGLGGRLLSNALIPSILGQRTAETSLAKPKRSNGSRKKMLR